MSRMNTTDSPPPPPEVAVIESRRKSSGLSIRRAAERAGLSDTRWRQITAGHQIVAPGNRVPVRAPADTLARMAAVVGASGQELAESGREDAAEALADLRRVSRRPPAVDAGPGSWVDYMETAHSWVDLVASARLLLEHAVRFRNEPAEAGPLLAGARLMVTDAIEMLRSDATRRGGSRDAQAPEPIEGQGGSTSSRQGGGTGSWGTPMMPDRPDVEAGLRKALEFDQKQKRSVTDRSQNDSKSDEVG